MGTVIHKYEITPGRLNSIAAGHVLTVAFQHGKLMAWVEHKDAEPGCRYVNVIPTGQEFPSSFLADFEHVGSAVSDDLVWHVYAAKDA